MPFRARPDSPSPPIMLLLNQTDIQAPTLPTPLMHSDLDSGPPLAFSEKAVSKVFKDLPGKKTKAVAFSSLPLSAWMSAAVTNSDVDSDSDMTGSISFMIPPGGPSHVKDSDFPILTGWTKDFIDEFQNAVEKLVNRKFDPRLSLKDQDPAIKAEVVAEIVKQYPRVNKFIDAWPLEKVLIRTCKNSLARLTRTAEKAVVTTAARNLRSRLK